MKKKILIIGGTGFLGYHLSKNCLEKGWNVTSISKKKPTFKRHLKKVIYLNFDITKKKILEKNIKENYDYVVNFAGYVNHYEKKKTFNSHYIGCKNLVDFFSKKKIETFIQIGSCTEYGSVKSPQNEKKKTKVNKVKSTYGKAKLMATNYLLKKFKEKKFPCVILRLYLVYGPKQDYNRLIPIVIKNCLQKKKFSCSEGTQLRDFLYIDDFVGAIFKAIKEKKVKGEILNIGYSRPLKVSYVINKIREIINSGEPNFGIIPLRKDEIKSLYPSIKKTKKLLKWKPRTGFLSGIKKTIKYYKYSLKN